MTASVSEAATSGSWQRQPTGLSVSEGVAWCEPPHDHLWVFHEVVDSRRDSRSQGQAGSEPVVPTLDIGNRTGLWEDMKDPEVIILDTLHSNNHTAYNKALEAASIALALVLRVPAPLKSLADQVIRAASSVPANLAEGHGRSGRDRIHHWRIAYASAKEVDSHLRLLAGAGAVNHAQANRALRIFDEVRAMTWRLIYPKL